MNDTNVTVYENIKQTTNGIDFTLPKIIDCIQNGHWEAKIAEYRDGKRTKKQLPYFTGSGTFNKRGEQGLVKHNSRLIIDIDKQDPHEIKGTLGCDKYVEYLFTSCSGNGIAAVFIIDPKQHGESFDAIQAYLDTEYGIEIDKACRDVSRARFISHDPDLVFNPDAIPFSLGKSGEEKVLDIIHNIISNSIAGERHHALLRASKLAGGYVGGGVLTELDAVSALERSFTERPVDEGYNYNQTIQDGIEYGKISPLYSKDIKAQAKKSKDESAAYKELHAQAHLKNSEGVDLDSLEAYIYELSGQLNIPLERCKEVFATIFGQFGESHGEKKKPVIVKVENHLSRTYEFRRNIITSTLEQSQSNTAPGVGSDWNKVNIDSVYRDILHRFPRGFGLDKLKSLLRSDYVEEYDPFAEYFAGLDKWDGVDHITALANHIQTDNQEFFLSMFRKHLVRSIGCGLGKMENRFVFVLVGEKQNTGKSSFLRFLNPFGMKYYTEAPLRDSKDTELQFAENFIYNLEELSALSNTDLNKLKAVISKRSVKERRPYAIEHEEMMRRCNFWGSTNRTDFLADTENTRWLCFGIESISFDYANMITGKGSIDINKVWAQAWHLYCNGDRGQLTEDEVLVRDNRNKGYEVANSERDAITEMFEIDTAHNQFYSVVQVSDLIAKQYPTMKITHYIVGKTLNQLGFHPGRKYMNGHQVRGYFCLPKGMQTFQDNEKRF
ncbi:MAG: VapE domain-containing protein [Nitrosomonadaceae bacterium]